MTVDIDLDGARSFLATHGRVLDRRRFELLLDLDRDATRDGERDADRVLAGLDAYRNPDGGYGWGLEPDLRSTSSQPVAAMHAFEVLAEVAPATSPRARELCDWLDTNALPDGGVPFALPVPDPAGCAPWFAQADTTGSSLQITAAVTAAALRVARHDPAVAAHPWLDAATRYCLEAIRNLDQDPHAYVLSFALQFLDAATDVVPEAHRLLEEVGGHLPDEGTLPVEGGLDDEMLRPLDYAPDPDRPVRDLLAPDVVVAELDRLARQQQPDGGWPVEWATASPAAVLEWRGHLTVRAIRILRHSSLA